MATIKKVRLAAMCAGSLALVAAAPAAAFPPVGSTVTGVDDGRGFDFGALTTCHVSLGGTVTSQDPWGGGTIRVDRTSFTGCTSGVTVTANSLPWTLGTDSTAAAALYPLDVNITTSRGTCRYSGSLLGSTNGAGTWWFTESVFKRTSGCGGADDLRTRVTLNLRDSAGQPLRM
jgi:hypothetical protein